MNIPLDIVPMPRDSRFCDLSGTVFGRWTVVGYVGKHGSGVRKNHFWLCQCQCGNQKAVARSALKSGYSRSCGCYRSEYLRKARTTHNMSKSAEYGAWRDMLNRCYNRNRREFQQYGGRGIAVCDEWRKSFAQFFADMGKRPGKCTLDRIDNDENYTPENCRWATWRQQQNNRSNNRRLTFDGHTLTVAEWARKTGLPPSAIYDRLYHGWDTERTLTEPLVVTERTKAEYADRWWQGHAT